MPAKEETMSSDVTTRGAVSPAAPARPWLLWCYAVRPGWESTGQYRTREEAREIRDELIEWDGYDPGWVSVRRLAAESPKRRPSQASIERVLAAGAEDEAV